MPFFSVTRGEYLVLWRLDCQRTQRKIDPHESYMRFIPRFSVIQDSIRARQRADDTPLPRLDKIYCIVDD